MSFVVEGEGKLKISDQFSLSKMFTQQDFQYGMEYISDQRVDGKYLVQVLREFKIPEEWHKKKKLPKNAKLFEEDDYAFLCDMEFVIGVGSDSLRVYLYEFLMFLQSK
jgi:hypothetical protein